MFIIESPCKKYYNEEWVNLLIFHFSLIYKYSQWVALYKCKMNFIVGNCGELVVKIRQFIHTSTYFFKFQMNFHITLCKKFSGYLLFSYFHDFFRKLVLKFSFGAAVYIYNISDSYLLLWRIKTNRIIWIIFHL